MSQLRQFFRRISIKELVDEGYLVRLGSGRKTMYVRTDALR